MTRGRRALALAGLLTAVVATAPTGAPASARVGVTWHPARPRPGDVAWVEVIGASGAAVVDGAVGGRPLMFFRHHDRHVSLVGLDVATSHRVERWHVLVDEPGRPATTVSGRLALRPRHFHVERLTLPPAMVELDPATDRRADEEARHLRTLYRTITPVRLWRQTFVRPVEGRTPGTGFGARRILNGQPREPHSGTDYRAPAGAPVVAANAGRVALVAEYYFPGRLVVLDHGLGLHTLYFHLDEVRVSEGDPVVRGQPIGTVGATGRATGPHLHFGAVVGSARVDPASLLAIRVPD